MCERPSQLRVRDRLGGLPAFPAALVCAAVPGVLRDDALAAACALDEPSAPAVGFRAARVAGEEVVLPDRLYVADVRPDALRQLPGCAGMIASAILTRHYDGYARERHLRTIIESEELWVTPFVVALLGDYVVEIRASIERRLGVLLDQSESTRGRYRAFVSENPEFMGFTRQRAISHWNRHHRSEYLRAQPRRAGVLNASYPTFTMLDRLESL